jgi:biotin carboxylase
MARVLLLLPTATYRAPDFLAAAQRLGVEVVVGSEHRQALARSMGDRAVVVPLRDVDAAVDVIAALHARSPLDAVVAVDDQGLGVAAASSQRLGLRQNSVASVAATRDKAVMRELLAASSVRQPDFSVLHPGDDVVTIADALGYPCVLKPVSRSASQGVIRVDNAAQAANAVARIRTMLDDESQNLLVESYVPGEEVAVEGLLTAGQLEVLAVFDKPDPLEGPYFEETIYVTPSRHAPSTLEKIRVVSGEAAAALGLSEGPVHVELRIGPDGDVTLLELAARSIGGLCSRALSFGAGVSLEEVILRHALGLGMDELSRELQASGVMMLPIRAAGVLKEVEGRDRALAVQGIVGLDITIAPGRELVALPEGDRYLGFIFARGPDPAAVEASLRRAEKCLRVVLE